VRSRKRNETLLEENRALELYVDASINSLRIANQQLESSRDAYRTLAEIDELTHLGNRRNFEKELGRSIALSKRLNVPLALLMIDIDHFKIVNDHHGHKVGDDHLRAVGKVLESAIRLGEDVAARIGGEEFAVLLLNTDTEGALLSAERIRAHVEGLALVNASAPRKIVTVSVGVAAQAPQTPMSRDEFVTRADRALYRAKGNGRNCVSP
jgi:diguanylate cyclase (GGDEF)-like protein